MQSLILIEPLTGWIAVPAVLPKGYDAKCKGLKELCKEKGWTYYLHRTWLIMGK